MFDPNAAVDLNYPQAADQMYKNVAAGEVSQEFLDAAEITQDEFLHIILFVLAVGGVPGAELMRAVKMYTFGRQRAAEKDAAIDVKEVDNERNGDGDGGSGDTD